ncbi:hypothetical protein R3P38DRAFT_2847509 [Favolaschia claudopus]|uniref:Uncharacterized protein n=1 Tax=Favolaschia claudopus TaxID=2862362 RepID=A0AAW0DVI0_9AGAR
MSSPTHHSSPERLRRGDSHGSVGSALNRVPEDEEPSVHADWELEEELLLEEQGFYQGSYNRLVALYTLAPVTAVVTFVLLAALPNIAFKSEKPHVPTYPYPAILPFPLLEILASIALFSLAHLLRNPIYALSAALLPFPLPATLLSTTVHTLLSTAARLFTLSILLVQRYALHPHATWKDPAFRRVWWAALGWAAAEAVVSVHQGYMGLALYREVLVPIPSSSSTAASPRSETERTPLLPQHQPAADLDTEVEQDLEQLIALKAREELEDVFGLPLVYIPAFIPCLQRFNSLLLSVGLFLLLSASQIGANLRWSLIGIATATHLVLAILHAPIVLPRIGVHGAAYVGSVVSLGAFFAGLGVWDGVS